MPVTARPPETAPAAGGTGTDEATGWEYEPWGEDRDPPPPTVLQLEDWELVLAEHGIEDICWRGLPVVPRVFFSLRDLRWETLEVRWSAVVTPSGQATASSPAGAGLVAEVPGADFELAGRLLLDGQALVVTYSLLPRAAMQLSRAAPCVLHAVPPPGARLEHDGPGGAWVVPDEFAAGPPISGYRQLSWTAGGLELGVELDGGSYELEDQRNWADGTLKSYSPPLQSPRPLDLPIGLVHDFAVRVTAHCTTAATSRGRAGTGPLRAAAIEGAGDAAAQGPLRLVEAGSPQLWESATEQRGTAMPVLPPSSRS